MQRKYHTYNPSAFPAPNAGMPMHLLRRQGEADTTDGGELIVVRRLEEKRQDKNGASVPVAENGRILGRFETDDIMLLCIIFLLLQNGDDLDMALLLALGYIFLSDKGFGIL